MRRRTAFQVLPILIPVLLLGLLPGAASADPPSEPRNRHEATVAFWTPARLRAAVPRDMTFDPDGGVEPRAPGGGRGKPSPTPTPTPTTPPAGVVTGDAWEAGGAALEGTGRVFFVMGAFLYSCSGSVVTDTRTAHSLVLTAGHCVIDKGRFATQWIYIPKYDTNPIDYGDCSDSAYGCWTAQGLYVHEQFASQKRFNDTAVKHDFAFAVMGPGGKSGTASLETTVGGRFGIEFSGPATGTVLTALGYPAGAPYDGRDLTYCRGPIGTDANTGGATWSMGCDMTGGSSGGPWVSGDAGSFGAVLRSLNSYGYSGLDNMYGPKFNSTTAAVYAAANSGPVTNTRVTGP